MTQIAGARDTASRSRFGAASAGSPSADAGSAERSGAIAPPTISLPKGGGAIASIGELFEAARATGTASLTVPLALPSGRGLSPALTLTYDSGRGNGPLGIGWSIGIPAITRSTDRRLPRYDDESDSDPFILAGGDELVPFLNPDGARHRDTTRDPSHIVRRYRPRTDDHAARIERWTHRDTGISHWRTIGADGTTSVYGASPESRVFDPERPDRIAEWLLCASWTRSGEGLIHRYRAGDDRGAPATAMSREHTSARYLDRVLWGARTPLPRDADGVVQDPSGRPDEDWLFELIVDYGEERVRPVPPAAGTDPRARVALIDWARAAGTEWPYRPDAFSRYRDGFEIRLARRVHGLLVLHHIPDAPDGRPGFDGLVRSFTFDYDDLAPGADALSETEWGGSTRAGSVLRAIQLHGHRPDPHAGVATRSLSVPDRPLRFDYSTAQLTNTASVASAETAALLPAGIDGQKLRVADLRGDALPSILVATSVPRAGASWYELRPIGDGSFGSARPIPESPAPRALSAHRRLTDLDGDGRLDLVTFGGTSPGVARQGADGWHAQHPFGARPVGVLDSPSVRHMDLDGDGLADLLISHDGFVRWYRSLGVNGWAPEGDVTLAGDPERGLRLSKGDDRVAHLEADMGGDGLADLVMVTARTVSYWPNLGRGRFGGRIDLELPEPLDDENAFDPQRVRLVDLDGTGCADIVYLGTAGIDLRMNLSGSALGQRMRLNALPVPDPRQVELADLHGHGVAAVLWSSALPGDRGTALRFLEPLGPNKPRLLTRTSNGRGLTRTIDYAPSTRFLAEDRLRGEDHVSTLPFPVHVVARIDVHDSVSGAHRVTQHRYRNGRFDGVERRFQGFGRCDSIDVDGDGPAADAPSSLLTRSWQHTGTTDESLPAAELFRPPGSDAPDDERPRTEIHGADSEDRRQVALTLTGRALRTETYAMTGADWNPPPDQVPLAVIDHGWVASAHQPSGPNDSPSVHVHMREEIDTAYDGALVAVRAGVITGDATAAVAGDVLRTDPRRSHRLVLEVDGYGTPIREASVAYPRRYPDATLPTLTDRDVQARVIATLVQRRTTVDALTGQPETDTADAYRPPGVWAEDSFEVVGLAVPSGGVITPAHLRTVLEGASLLSAHTDPSPGGIGLRITGAHRQIERAQTLSSDLPPGRHDADGLTAESYDLAFEDDAVAGLADLADAAALRSAGYVRLPGEDGWWSPTGRTFFSTNEVTADVELAAARAGFYRPSRFRDIFPDRGGARDSRVRSDHWMLADVETVDRLGNTVTVGHRRADGSIDHAKPGLDYRVLAPAAITDPNGERTEVVYDARGVAVAHVASGSDVDPTGDAVLGVDVDFAATTMDALANDPAGVGRSLLKGATSLTVEDLRISTDTHPASIWTFSRATHVADLSPGQATEIHISVAFLDASGAPMQTLQRASDGPLPQREADGTLAFGPDGQQRLRTTTGTRWRSSGRIVRDTKGRVIREFEPYFTDHPRPEPDTTAGVATTTIYDAIDRVVAVVQPDGRFTMSLATPWRLQAWDAIDTIRLDPRSHAAIGALVRAAMSDTSLDIAWYALRMDPAHAPAFENRFPDAADRAAEQRAAAASFPHRGTPELTELDPLGRAVILRSRMREATGTVVDGVVTRVELDIEGDIARTWDGLGRVVERTQRDLLGRRTVVENMDSGRARAFTDAAGGDALAEDAAGVRLRIDRDALGRPTAHRVTGADPANPGREVVTELTVYGEQIPGAAASRLRGSAVLVFDQAGLASTQECGRNGGPTRQSRTFATHTGEIVDWSAIAARVRPGTPMTVADILAAGAGVDGTLEPETYLSDATNDALGRRLTGTPAHLSGTPGHTIRYRYGRDGAVGEVELQLDSLGTGERVLDAVERDAHGRRVAYRHGNGVRTHHTVDPWTGRLAGLVTERPSTAFPGDRPAPDPAWPGADVRNVRYHYDPVGSVVAVRDRAQQAIFFRNRRVDADSSFEYDAMGRLVSATGREQLTGAGGVPVPHSYDDRVRVGQVHPGDGGAVARYAEHFSYDAAGNLLEWQHQGQDSTQAGWTRTFTYEESSLLEPERTSNRLTSTTVAGVTERFGPDAYDARGALTRMAQLSEMRWDHRGLLAMTRRERVDPLDVAGQEWRGRRTWYTYDSAGVRARKVTVSPAGVILEDRRYLGGVEIFHRHGPTPVERETLTVSDDDGIVVSVELRRSGGSPGEPARLDRYSYTDLTGSVAVELDGAARVISYEEYAPYGATVYRAVASGVEVPTRHRFAGQERDEESGLYANGARYYAPWLARWTSADPLGIAGGGNVYAYAACDPVGLSDDDGHAPKKKGSAPKKKTDPYERQRKKDTRAQKKKLLAAQERAANPPPGEAPKTPDPMKKYAEDYAETHTHQQRTKSGKSVTVKRSAIQGHHHGRVEDAKRLGVPLQDMGKEMVSVLTVNDDEAVKAIIQGEAGSVSHHDALHANQKKPMSIAEFEMNAELEKWRTPATVDMEARAGMDWKPTVDKGPLPDPDGVVRAAKDGTKKVLKEAAEETGHLARLKKIATNPRLVRAGAKLTKAGRLAMAAVPVIGILATQASAAEAANRGDYVSAALDEAGMIPIAGDVLDAGRAGMAVGEAATELLPLERGAIATGEAFESAATWVGFEKDTARTIGAVGGAVGAIGDFALWTNPATAGARLLGSLW